MSELPIPPAAVSDDDASEFVRLWLADNQPQVALRIGVWHDAGMDEAAGWGIIIADIIKNAAEALSREYDWDREETILAIHQALIEHLGEDSDEEVDGCFEDELGES